MIYTVGKVMGAQNSAAKEKPPLNFDVMHKRQQLAYEYIDDGDQFIAENIGEAGLAVVESRNEIFKILATNFSTSLGK